MCLRLCVDFLYFVSDSYCVFVRVCMCLFVSFICVYGYACLSVCVRAWLLANTCACYCLFMFVGVYARICATECVRLLRFVRSCMRTQINGGARPDPDAEAPKRILPSVSSLDKHGNGYCKVLWLALTMRRELSLLLSVLISGWLLI